MTDKVIPDKQGLWWYDVKLVHKNATPDSYCFVDVFYRRQWSGLTYSVPGETRIREVDENTEGFLSAVLTHEQADELKRHAAALEAQVADLEREIVELAELDRFGASDKIAEAMRDD